MQFFSDKVETLWEKEKMLIPSIFSFSRNILKAFSLRVFKSLDCVVEVNSLPQNIVFRFYPTMFSSRSTSEIITWAAFILSSANAFNLDQLNIFLLSKEYTEMPIQPWRELHRNIFPWSSSMFFHE